MKHLNKISSFLILSLFAGAVFSCSDSDSETAKIQVALVDTPADYDKVLIDIQDVQINVSSDATDENGWQSLEGMEAKLYDLLLLTNGEEALLGEIELPEGQLGQIRLILGEANQLVIDDEEINLTVPSGSQSGLKLNVGADISAGITYKLVVDFDAAKSVVKSGNSGKYNLKPVIRAEMDAQTGAIEGVVSPADISAVVYAVAGDDSVSTYPDENGDFLIRALQEGTYDVVAIPANEENFEKISNEGVDVIVGEVTPLDTLKFE